MKVVNSLRHAALGVDGATIAIGVFDGVHIGHRRIIERAVADARTHGRSAVVFTFDRHPEETLAPERAPAYLSTPDVQAGLIRAIGVDVLVRVVFDRAFSLTTAETFLDRELQAGTITRAIVVGQGFTFGAGRRGTVALLQSDGEERGYTVDVLEPVVVDGEVVSSTYIRTAIAEGRFGAAEAALGRPYEFIGSVIRGLGVGRGLGAPTANLDNPHDLCVPRDGVYAVTVELPGGSVVGGVASLGSRPTLTGAGYAFEVHVLDGTADLYGKELRVRFITRIRDQARLPNLEALAQVIQKDIADARRMLAGVPVALPDERSSGREQP